VFDDAFFFLTFITSDEPLYTAALLIGNEYLILFLYTEGLGILALEDFTQLGISHVDVGEFVLYHLLLFFIEAFFTIVVFTQKAFDSTAVHVSIHDLVFLFKRETSDFIAKHLSQLWVILVYEVELIVDHLCLLFRVHLFILILITGLQ
jgi:hypothetical protein